MMSIEKEPWQNGPPPGRFDDDDPAKTTASLGVDVHDGAVETDVGNSARFVADHSERLRFVGSWGKWLAWDGKRWEVDVTGQADQLAKITARRLLEEALEEMARDGQSKGVKARVRWAVQAHESKRLSPMVKLSRSAPSFAVSHSQLDADPWLFNVANGTLDLRTGKLARHDPLDLITKIAPVRYDPHATCPAWDAFLARTMGGDAELLGYLARVVGYSITGIVREHMLGFLFGGGANGKSTFLGTVKAMLGNYATQAPRGLLFRSQTARHETEYTTLFGSRFAVCAEIEEGAAFDEALVKDLTGGDAITARRMREDHWTFEPTHKLFIPGNHKPRVRGGDDGIWRRIRLIPWTVTIPPEERDPELKEKLLEELPGILAWAVRGCAEWQRHGLGDPPRVLQATAEYREQSDPLREFFDFYVRFEESGRISRSLLRDTYESHCKETGAEPLGAKRFAEALYLRGVATCSVRVGCKVLNGWRGLRLSTEEERSAGLVST